MIIKTDETGAIIAYADVGSIDGGVAFAGYLPEKFKSDFKPKMYRLDGDLIILNNDYVEPLPPSPADQQDEINAFLLKEVAALHAQLGGVNNG